MYETAKLEQHFYHRQHSVKDRFVTVWFIDLKGELEYQYG